MPSKLKKAIEAVKDQTSISLAKVATTSYTNVEVAVLKATTHDHIPIDEQHVYQVVRLVSSNKIYAAACARAIGRRISRTHNWIVALKSLTLVLRVFQDGDPYFPREVLSSMKRGVKILNLSSFRDDSTSNPWDYTAFVRTFALYLDERLDCFLTVKLQFRYKNKEPEERSGCRGSQRTNEPVADMKPAMLLDKIAFWQRLLERAIATRPTGAAKTNRLVLISLYAIVQESFDLYKDIWEGLNHLLDSFSHLQRQDCVGVFETCKKAAKQFEELAEFYSVCGSIGVGRTSEYPIVQKITTELIERLHIVLKNESSFLSASKSFNRLALPPVPGSNSEQQETGKITTGEISAAEAGETQRISIELKANSDPFDKKPQQDEALTSEEESRQSTHSLPMSSSVVDLVSIDDIPEQEEEEEEHETSSKQEPQQLESVPLSTWEHMLAESIHIPSTQPDPSLTKTVNAGQKQENEREEMNLRSGELVLAESTTLPVQQTYDLASSLYNLYVQPEQNVPKTISTFTGKDEVEQKENDTRAMKDWEIGLAEATTRPMQQKPHVAPQHYNPFSEN